MKDLCNYSLLAHNTFGINARCARFLEYETTVEAQQVAEILRESSLPYIIVGGGSNLLLTRDFPGIVVHSAVKGWDIVGKRMACGSGEVWDDIVAISLRNGLYGAENLSLIPGDVGASAVQNIGAYGVEAKDFIREVHAVEIATGRLCIIDSADCNYGYRQSRFKEDWKNRFLITMVVYEFSDTFQPRLDYGNIRGEMERQGISEPTPQQLRQIIIDIRNAKLPDPQVQGNAGSFFMNPVVCRAKYEELAAQYPQMPHYTIDSESATNRPLFSSILVVPRVKRLSTSVRQSVATSTTSLTSIFILKSTLYEVNFSRNRNFVWRPYYWLPVSHLYQP